jgi:WD40 repeat protein
MPKACRLTVGAAWLALLLPLGPAHAELRGHGGSIRALAVSPDPATALTGSFDTSAISWSLRQNLAEQVLRLHESAVNAVAILNDGRAVTAGADAIIGIWTSSTNRSINRSRPFRHTPFPGKFVEQRVLIDLPLPHHRLPPAIVI